MLSIRFFLIYLCCVGFLCAGERELEMFFDSYAVQESGSPIASQMSSPRAALSVEEADGSDGVVPAGSKRSRNDDVALIVTQPIPVVPVEMAEVAMDMRIMPALAKKVCTEVTPELLRKRARDRKKAAKRRAARKADPVVYEQYLEKQRERDRARYPRLLGPLERERRAERQTEASRRHQARLVQNPEKHQAFLARRRQRDRLRKAAKKLLKEDLG